MNRRAFLALIGAATPFMSRAQQPAMPVIGLISGTNREPRFIDAIRQGLGETGYVEGRNFIFEYRWAEGDFERLPGMAQDLVRRQVSLIMGMQSAAAPRAAKAATTAIPVVFCIGGDPVRLGLVASLSRPGGNVSGTTFLVNTLGAKRVELLRELVPSGAVIGVLVNPKNPAAESEMKDVYAAAQTLGQKTYVQNASDENGIDSAFANFAQQRANAVTFAAVLFAKLDPHPEHVAAIGTAHGADSIGVLHFAEVLRIADRFLDACFNVVAHQACSRW